ncbi:MAG: hypothetical protein A2Y14_00475 [Verrucomicrobia bacterium GWF2_51_19]|nr:MAG: hypothetical protein A2Y14_00475 [Verrucomicrobia bacterium GWF2_51_19]HCJ12191.1 hypothetical protein [Opitutae bacterium]
MKRYSIILWAVLLSTSVFGTITWHSEEVCAANVRGDTYAALYYGDIDVKYNNYPRIVWGRPTSTNGGAFYRYKNIDGSWGGTTTKLLIDYSPETYGYTEQIRIVESRNESSEFAIVRLSGVDGTTTKLWLDYYDADVGSDFVHTQLSTTTFRDFDIYGMNAVQSDSSTVFTVYLVRATSSSNIYFSILRNGATADYLGTSNTIAASLAYLPYDVKIFIYNKNLHFTWNDINTYTCYYLPGTETGYINSPSYSFGSVSPLYTGASSNYTSREFQIGFYKATNYPFTFGRIGGASNSSVALYKYNGSAWTEGFTFATAPALSGSTSKHRLDPATGTFVWTTREADGTNTIKVAYYDPSERFLIVETVASGLPVIGFISVKRKDSRIHIAYGTVSTPKIYYVYGDVE